MAKKKKTESKPAASKKKAAAKKTAAKKKPTAQKKVAPGKKASGKETVSAKKKKKSPVGKKNAAFGSVKITLNQISDSFRHPEAAYRRARNVLEARKKELLNEPGVKAVEVGVKQVEGRSTGIIAIRILVNEKLKNRAGFVRIGASRFSSGIDGVPVDIIPIRTFIEAVDDEPGHRFRGAGGPGTLGAHVFLDAPVERRYLTAGHVVTTAPGSSTITMKDGGGTDAGKIKPVVGENYDRNRTIDCALVTPPKGTTFDVLSNGMFDVIRLRDAVSSDLHPEVVLWKKGANDGTGFTQGTLLTFDSDERDVIGSDGKLIKVEHQLIIKSKDRRPFAKPGDSGAIVCIEDRAIGVVRAISKEPGPFGHIETIATPFSQMRAPYSDFETFNFFA